MIDFLYSWPEWVVILIVAVGLFTLSLLIYAILDGLWKGFKELIQRLIYFAHRKTRFHRKPIAKCYCRDCENWHPHECKTEGKCWGHSIMGVTADEWFCWDATPRKTERNDI